MSGVQKLSHAARRARLITALSFLPLATVAASIALAVGHLQAAMPVSGQAATALVVALLAMVQIRLLWLIGKQADPWRSAVQLPWQEFGKCGVVAALVVFGIAVSIEQQSTGEFVLIVAAAAAAAILLLPIAAPTSAISFWRRLGKRRWVRKASLAAYSAAVCLVSGELVLQGIARLPVESRGSEALPTAQASLVGADRLFATAGSTVESTEWSQELPRGLRLAMVGDSQSLDQLTGNLLNQHDSDELPVTVRRFVTDDHRGTARHLAEEVTAAGPEMVLAVISIGSDFAGGTGSGWLDWRNLQIPRYVAGVAGNGIQEQNSDMREQAAFEKLSVCRPGASRKARAQWKQISEQVAVLAKRCREKHVPLALVVLPAKFQLNRPACDALLHQAGYQRDSLDLELPQRRLAALAHREQVALLDLMPELRLSDRSLYQRGSDALSEEGRSVVQGALSDWIERSVSSDRILLADLRNAR